MRDAKTPGARNAISIAGVLAAGLLALSASSCAPRRPVDFAGYERMPNSAAGVTIRALANTTPVTRRALYYGNYGGPGNLGGVPQDEMDELFRRHDIVYYLARAQPSLRVADQELVQRLKELETRTLDEGGEKYRQRSIGFFESPVSAVVGKPIRSLFFCREPAGSYFANHEIVRKFFSRGHPGMPESGGQRSVIRGQ